MSDPKDGENSDINQDQLNGLISAAGVDGAQEIFESFWRSTTKLLLDLDAEVKSDAFDAAARTAHAVKGSAANVGALRLAGSAGALETACKNGEHGSVLSQASQAKADFDAFKLAVDAHFAQLSE